MVLPKTTIDSGTYAAVKTAGFIGTNQSSLPLVFALDATQNAFYFQATSNGYVKVPLFVGSKVQQLEAVIRVQPVEGRNSALWAGALFTL